MWVLQSVLSSSHDSQVGLADLKNGDAVIVGTYAAQPAVAIIGELGC